MHRKALGGCSPACHTPALPTASLHTCAGWLGGGAEGSGAITKMGGTLGLAAGAGGGKGRPPEEAAGGLALSWKKVGCISGGSLSSSLPMASLSAAASAMASAVRAALTR